MKKKIIAVFLALTTSLCIFSMTGCSLINKGDSQVESESKEENDEEDEDWIPNVDLPDDVIQKPDLTEDIKVCNCESLCDENNINTSCEVCKVDFHKCESSIIATQPEETDPLDEFALAPGVTQTVDIIAFGSNFYNDAVINGTDKSYDYSYIYENIKEKLKDYDVKIVTQETVFTNNPSEYSGKAPYKSPTSIATALQDTGFNVIASATNHSYDNGQTGILDTLNMWKVFQNDVLITGISQNENRDNLCMIDVNGIRVSFLSYTTGLDGVSLTNKEKGYVKILNDEEDIAEDIRYAAKITDFVIVLPHWGREDAKSHTVNQEDWATIFVDNGADLIIGTGSNYLQDVETYESKDGQIVPCYYSLGNFVSPKDNPDEVLSGAAEVTISKTGKTTTIVNYNLTPVALHVSKKGDFFKSYLLDSYPADTIKWHNLIANGKELSLDGMKAQFDDIFNIQMIKNHENTSENIEITTPETNGNNTSTLPNLEITN